MIVKKSKNCAAFLERTAAVRSLFEVNECAEQLSREKQKWRKNQDDIDKGEKNLEKTLLENSFK